MITARDDYIELLYRIQNTNHSNTILKLPKDEPIYNIDLNTRTIQTPKEIINLEFDHNAETIYFAVDRYFDNVDLSTLTCVVQYKNANPKQEKNGYIYAVPYFDLVTLKDDNKILFQWAIEGSVTAYTGEVVFSLKFYKLSSREDIDENGHPISIPVYDYVLNTLTSKLKIEKGMDVLESTNENYHYDSNTVSQIYEWINALSKMQTLRWVRMEEYDDMQPILATEDYPSITIDKSNEIYANINT